MDWRLHAFTLLCLICELCADLFLHNPRGSNNRLKENTADRTNANRLFDSQDNARGGYNVGDAGSAASGNNEEKQYRMKYYQSGPTGQTYLTIEWTNQHGCGGNERTDPQKQNCVLVLQYMCQTDGETATGSADTFRNGVSTTTQSFTNPASLEETGDATLARKTKNVAQNKGLHESWDWYNSCYIRNRNNGLFTADQDLQDNNLGYSSAKYTRQNANGDQYGYECPEERDYFPYWHPTPWRDIAILTEAQYCDGYEKRSFNTLPYGQCVEFYENNNRKYWSKWNNKAECEANQGSWVEFLNYLENAPWYSSESECTRGNRGGHRYIWGIPYDTADVRRKECLVALDRPDCREAHWSRSNHLGNGVDGEPLNYTWALPHFPSGENKRCVFRMRYNISTDDYDPQKTDSRYNQKDGQKSPITNDPLVNIGGYSPLQLAINTAQYGRVFQDRSHVFLLRARPAGWENHNIFNLNVRGKRGNIVQAYPAVEYDFFPTTLRLREDDYVHIQWTGSNTHNNGGNSDGQTGSDGQGTAGTDRTNLVQINNRNENFPVPYENSTMWNGVEILYIHNGLSSLSSKDLAVSMSSSGYYSCIKDAVCGAESVESKTKLNNLLNNAPASYEGAVLKFRSGTYHYMCTRNNNYTNRSQKGSIIVQSYDYQVKQN